MTTDLCTEDVVVQITSPQIISPDAVTIRSNSGGGGRVQASSAAVELGRRLLLAARAGNTAQVLDLMAKGAPFTTDWLGTSPLHLAAGGAHADTCGVLLRAGVSRDARTKVERTPLHLAAAAGHAAVAELLLRHGAAADCRDLLRMTPLHWAAERGHAAVAAALLRHGADPAAVSKFRKTPRQLAARRGHADVLALLDAAPPPPPPPAMHRLTDIKVNTTKILEQPQPTRNDENTEMSESPPGTDVGAGEGAGSGAGEGAAARLLRRHGITLLPTDDGSTVLSALQSGRTVVLSDAGKLMLKESNETSATVTPIVSAKPAPSQKGVVLTATPVKTPPKPGVKIFTINNKLLAIPKDNNKIPIKKIINPQDMQVKFVQLPADAKIVSPRKSMQLKAKTKLSRPPVKIIVNKANYSRLVAAAPEPTAAETTVKEIPESACGEGGGEAGAEERSLRAQLAAAQRCVAGLSAELAACRARLARYERMQ